MKQTDLGLSRLRHIFKPALAVFALALSGLIQAQTVTLDKVIAIVDNDVVMASELEQQIQIITRRLQSQNTQIPPADVLRAQILEHLIVERIQLQMAHRAGLTISNAELNQTLQRMQQANNLTQEQFTQQLAQEGLTPALLREQIRREMLVSRVQKGQVNRRIKISGQEVDNFLNSKEGEFWASPDYNLGHILIPASPASDQEDINAAEKKARQLYEQISSGSDFKKLAIANSAGQFALQGGDLGWRKSAQLPELFAKVARNLTPGTASEPFQSDAGFHILKLYQQRGGGEQLVEQTKVRHILLKPSTILSDDEARTKLVAIRDQARQGSDFSALAKEHSEDIGSMLSGGDLGWSTPGQFVPEFEATMTQTPVGQISEPFRSQFGWHILYVEDRRKEDMSDVVMRNQARNILRKRRFEGELQNWLQEIRDEAYVEIKEQQ